MVTGKSLRIDVSKDQIDEALNARIKDLEKELKKLKVRNRELEKVNKENTDVVERVKKLIQVVNDEAGFVDITEYTCI